MSQHEKPVPDLFGFGKRALRPSQRKTSIALCRLGGAWCAPMPPAPRLVLFTRYPTPGAAKTRLIPSLGAAGAASVHKQLTERTLEILQPHDRAVEVHYTGEAAAAFSAWLGRDILLKPQVEGGLTERMMAALDPAPVIFFGADTPDLQASHVSDAVAGLAGNDVVIGPAEDGGYYLIGLARPHRFLLEDMPWSTDQVFPETLRRLQERGMSPVLLETLADCDRPDDLPRWPWLAQ
jgi:uncharacterized protein